MDFHSFKFTAGVILLILNPLIGWGGVAIFLYLFKKTKKNIYHVTGALVYSLSWAMLFLGTYLSKERGIEVTRSFFETNTLPKISAIILIFITILMWLHYWINYRKHEK